MEQSKKDIFKCSACGNMYKTKGSLCIHVRAQHEGVVYSCSKCSKQFKHLPNRNKHEKMCGEDQMEQSKKYIFKCSACGNTYKTKSSLCIHVRAQHEGVVYSCSKCTKMFKYSNSKNKHEKMCSGEVPVCQICEKQCITNRGLRHHLRIHEITPNTAPPRPQTEYSHTQDRVDTGNADEADWRHYQRAMQINPVMMGVTSVSNDSVPESRKKTSKSNCLEIDPIPLSNDIRSVLEKKMSTGDRNSAPRDYNLVVMDTAPKRKTERHVCDTCGKMYTAASLRIHIKTVHKGVRYAHCEICGKGFISAALLRRHMTVHTGDKLYKCDLCDKSLSQLSALHRHKKNVHQVHSPVCQVCKRCFQTEESLQNHVRITHTIQPLTTVSCSVCGRTYFTHSRLRRHIREAHTDRPLKFACDECDKKFTTKAILRKHFFQVHNHNKSKNDDKNFTCIVCEMVFISYKKLEKHRKVCRQAYTCGVCNKQCVSSASLSRHITNQHLNVRKASNKLRKTCEICGKKLRDSCALRQHVKIHSDPVSCDKCGLRFKQRHNLANHRWRTSCKTSRKTESKNKVEQPESDIEANFSSLRGIKKEVTSVGSLNSDVGKLLSQKDIKMEIDNDVESFFYDRENHLSLKDDVRMSFDNCDLSLG